ncbi:hypothetical protein WA026_003284 [Henosepilachna vigintioctopunctata]|uniref:Cytochrome P450 n=1 Tax=Henosepilachna vigintioctopunctata TaxID=420089 RepID=A0AAW1TIR0_9CUCU
MLVTLEPHGRNSCFHFIFFVPAIANFLGLSPFGKELRSFFVNLVKDTIKLREEKNIRRADMLGLLIEARKGTQIEETTKESIEVNFAAVEEHLEERNTKRELSDLDIASQVFVFFLGGFESVSNAMCFMAYELAVNVDVQMKLIQEIDENRNEDGVLSYETIANLIYLDMVVSESLRKWPVTVFTDRTVTKPYTIKPELPDEMPLSLEVGDQVIVPIMGLHYDTKYFENPEKFIPERFSPENRKNIKPYTYLPFGVGPRNCIGSRFALLEIKAVFFHILSHFEIVPVEKTNIPLQISKKSFNFTSVNGFPLGLKRRQKRI